jgi:NAD-dependent deacetylase
MPPLWQAKAEQTADLWRQARFPIALTGAGISVASGIPDFRSPDGLWTRHDPAEVATLDALHSRPDKVWDLVYDIMLVLERAKPNPAHTALAELEAGGRLKAIITQNIDSLHQQAGSRNVVEFHGSGRRFYCMGCHEEYDPAGVRSLTRDDLPWTCGMCQRVIRPDFVFFGERIPEEPMGESMRLMELADLCLVVGTSGEVAPANTLPYRIKASGGRVVEINLGPSIFGELPDVRFDAPAEEVLPSLARLVLQSSS